MSLEQRLREATRRWRGFAVGGRPYGQFLWRFEFKPQDAWIGVFWRSENDNDDLGATHDVWICLVPCIPLHLRYVWGI